MRAVQAFCLGMQAALVAVLIASCGGPELSPHPRVVVDGSFTGDELSGVLDGLAGWERAVPEFAFRVSFEDHESTLGAASTGAYSDTIYILRNEGNHDACPIPGDGELGADRVGLDYSHDDQAVICLDAVYVNANDGLWTDITLHEVGHALHLPHYPAPSVMAIPYGNGQPAPTPSDIQHVRDAWGF